MDGIGRQRLYREAKACSYPAGRPLRRDPIRHCLLVHDKPDLLLSDIGLPNVDGYQLLSTIRSDLPEEVRDIPAVALTAFAGGDHQDKAKRVRVSGPYHQACGNTGPYFNPGKSY